MSRTLHTSSRAKSGFANGGIVGVNPMVLALVNHHDLDVHVVTIRKGYAAGKSIRQITEDCGLPANYSWRVRNYARRKGMANGSRFRRRG